MIQAPLQEVTEANRPGDTLGTIRLNINSPMPAMWVVVESDYDVKIYEKFFSKNQLNVRSSLTEGEQSCNNVELIVKTVLEEGYERIVGIRDRDFVDFIQSYVKPTNVYLTDKRDIEMQMLNSDNVVLSLKQKDAEIEQKMDEVKPIARAIGCYRIFNDIHRCGFSFKKNVKHVVFYDESAGKLIESPLSELNAKFFENRFNEEKKLFAELKNQCDGKDYSFVCRGHDFVKFLQYLTNVPDLVNFIPKHYNMDSFKLSNLYADLNDWAEKNDVSLFA